jgi:hypothetical protein
VCICLCYVSDYFFFNFDAIFAGNFDVPAEETVGAADIFPSSGTPSADCLHVRSMVSRPRVVPLRTVGSPYRPIPLGQPYFFYLKVL